MSNEDKVKNKIEDLGGRAKEAIGKATGDHDTRERRPGRPGEVQPERRRREGERRIQEVTQAC